jgi:CheY-like chemotaxis protein
VATAFSNTIEEVINAMQGRRLIWTKLGLFVFLVAFALFVLLYPGLTNQEIDTSVPILITLAVLVVILPWERLTSLKAAGVELQLDRPQIDKAIGDLRTLKGKENINDEKVRALLNRLAPEIEQSRGSRILWIDNRPNNVWGERRLFRALEIETVMAVSSEMATHMLETDGDFDLLISDMRGARDVEPGDDTRPDAVRFVEQLRETETARLQEDRYKHIPPLSVVFYSGKPYSRLLDYTQSVRGAEPLVVIAQGLETFLFDVLRILSQVRSEPAEIVIGPSPDRNDRT